MFERLRRGLESHRPLLAAGGLAVLVGGLLVVSVALRGAREVPLTSTVADLKAVHAGVLARGVPVHGLVRLSVGDRVATDEAGWARMRLDDGTTVIVDHGTVFELTPRGFDVERGRVFVEAPAGELGCEIGLSSATVVLRGAAAGLERDGQGEGRSQAKVYCATEQLTVRVGEKDHAVRSGQSATIAQGEVVVAAERVFDDWTGGLAAPWAARGRLGRAVGEVWARPRGSVPGEADSPLTIRSHTMAAVITGEMARTRVETTYFNGGAAAVDGDFRVALPTGALLSQFAWSSGGDLEEGSIALASQPPGAGESERPVLEWAGEGWLRGRLPGIGSGRTVRVVIEYVEWLSPVRRADRLLVQYRYPLVGEGEPPLIGEFAARVDARPSRPLAVAAGQGARADRGLVELRRSDFRPTADLVVEVEVADFGAPARAYVAPAAPGDDRGRTVLIRTDLPSVAAPDGVALALVLDVSASVDPALLDAARSLVRAVLEGLGKRDRVVVLAADQSARPIGPATLGAVTPERRQAIGAALDELSAGGATDLGLALEAGADALAEASAVGGMVVYLGDGWPTVGDRTAEQVQARLAQRPSGPPRLGAVAFGPVANRALLATLTRGSGPLLEVADASQAARAAVGLMEEALRPSVTGVQLVLGPDSGVEHVYPRQPGTVVAGESVWAVGRLREGRVPQQVTLRWHTLEGVERRTLGVIELDAHQPDDVRRRWAQARVEHVVVTGKGAEAAADVALRASLMTPWTGFVVGGGRSYAPTQLASRVLDLSSVVGAAYATPATAVGALAAVPAQTLAPSGGTDDDFSEAVRQAARRVIKRALPAVRRCRDSRAGLRPELAGTLRAVVVIDGEGRPQRVAVRGTMAGANDPALNRCVKVLLEGLDYPASGLPRDLEIVQELVLPPAPSAQRRTCSSISRLTMPLRRGAWRERLLQGEPIEEYLAAKNRCELLTWSDRRAFLELLLDVVSQGPTRIRIAHELELSGEADAARLLRHETVRRARGPSELRTIREALLGVERYPLGVFQQRYERARDHADRLVVVQRFLEIAPHAPVLRRRQLALLEALDRRDELVREVGRVRQDPFADAALLADGAAALRRAGQELEARRTFGELAERAPSDPWARAYLGDRLRNEGWFDDATAAYQALVELLPAEPAATIRLALAHHGAGRVDLAHRLLVSVAQTGGQTGQAHLSRLAAELAAILLAGAREGAAGPAAEQLAAAALELPRSSGRAVVLVRPPAGAAPLDIRLLSPSSGRSAQPQREPEVAAAGIGLYSLRFDAAAEQGLELQLRWRSTEPPPAPKATLRVDTLVSSGPNQLPQLASREVPLGLDAEAVSLVWRGSGWAL